MGRDVMPLGETPPTAAGAGMLGDEDGVAAHRRLFAVVRRLRRREPLLDEAHGVNPQNVLSFSEGVGMVGGGEMKAGPKSGLVKTGENVGKIRWQTVGRLSVGIVQKRGHGGKDAESVGDYKVEAEHCMSSCPKWILCRQCFEAHSDDRAL